ncbi:MAG: DMT family transporter [Chitinophagaceae bacterium]|nr:DMT family transporter [Chitinophagaceae bacterium]
MNNKLISWIIFILLCFIWGSSFILMKESLKGLTATQVASLRIFSAAVVFLPFAFFHISRIPKKKMGLVVLAGLFGNLLPAFCFAIAILKLDSSLAGILNSLTPICVATIAIVFFRDKIKARKIAGVIIGFSGLCVLTFTQKNISLDNLGYSLLIIAGTIFYGINVNLVGHYLKGINPVYLATVSLSFMSLPAFCILWQQGFFQLDFSDAVTQWSVINSVLLGITASSFATIIFYMLVQRAGGLFASLVTYGIPFVALFWGFLDGESITVTEITGLIIILFGVFLANWPGKKESGTKAPPAEYNAKKQ